MSQEVVFSRGADLDIFESIQWYNEQRPELGNIFFDRIIEKVKVITDNPKLFSIRYENVYCAALDQFPCLIHYK